MCGINGIFFRDRERVVSSEAILNMRDCMVHRGPDDGGLFLDGNVGLGHRRLSIIGLTTGHQPMLDSGEDLVIVYNGETYNYAELRKSLMEKGYRFRTESDTEVVLNLYSEYGPNCVDHMNGLFAFAIWDKRKQNLFIARDRLGIKPLYFSNDGDSFVFASEIKSILRSGSHLAALNDLAVYEYFLFRAISGERTLFKGVNSLLPGHRMLVSATETIVERYWDEYSGNGQSVTSPDEAVECLDELLTDAVNIRLMSEVPLGTFCSGGVDSSLVTALAARERGSAINTFSVGFCEKGFDESEYARMVSDKYGTTHHEIQITGGSFAEYLPELVRMNDEPLNFANSVHIYAVSKLAKEHVTVVLTGEGADELFLGYPRYHLPAFAKQLDRARWLSAPILSAGASMLNDHRLTRLRHYLDISPKDRVLLNAASAEPHTINAVLDKALRTDIEYRRSVVQTVGQSSDLMKQLSINDQKTYLVSILNRQDKMSMAASVEARVPFLDYRIVEFANHIESRFKTNGWDTKRIVKKVAARYLPDEVINRRKSGFGVPLAEYFRDDLGLGETAQRLIHETEYRGLLDKNVLSKRLNEHRAGAADHSELLWTAVNFLTWKEQYQV